MPLPARPIAAASLLLVSGCSGVQSWIDPASRDAATVADLFWVMLAGAGAIWLTVLGLAVYAGMLRPMRQHSERMAARLILWGGIVAPTGVIAALLVAGLLVLDGITGRSPDLSLQARGEQWWWRIAHNGPDGTLVPTPNELRLPAGRTAEIVLTANRVIHSFWAPALGGKTDLIPGRTNRMTLTPDRPGTWRGQCAEFCGEAHAQMAFPVVVMEPAAFDAWLARQAAPAAPPETPARRQGLALFLSHGCGACHTIRGTEARGAVGPDLTHIGSRLTIGAGTLPMGLQAMQDWIAAPERIKPGVRMPAFAMLPQDEIAAIAGYLVGLE